MFMFDSANGDIPANATDILVPSDGIYAANTPAIKAKFPNARYHTYTAIGQAGAEWIDCETGCVWPPDVAVELWRKWKPACKGFYCSKNTKPLLQYALWPGESPEWFEADITGVAHILPGDVATQYLWAGSYDESETSPEFEGDPPPPPVLTQYHPAQEENMILRDPQTGGLWVVESSTGAIFCYDNAPYLGATNNTTVNPGSYPCVGIMEYHDASGVGYELVLDWGDNGSGHSPDGGDRYRRYRFPRDGSAKNV